MRRLRACSVLLAVALLAACQTSEDSRVAYGGAAGFGVQALAPSPGRRVAERRGWVVEAVAGTVTEPAHCRAFRPGDDGPRLSFQAAPGSFAMLIAAPDRLLAPGANYELTLTFEGAAPETHTAVARDSSTLMVRIQSHDYEDVTDPYARAKGLEVSSPRLGGRIAAFPLAGSNWAVNALDECRRLNTRS